MIAARYHERSVAINGDALLVAGALARDSAGPYVLYERGPEWCFAEGAAVELVVGLHEIRLLRGGASERVVPTRGAPLTRLAELLGELRIGGWRAYGWAGFELSYVVHGLRGEAGGPPLLHLFVPQREVRIQGPMARLRALDPADLDVLETAVTAVPAEPDHEPHPLDVSDHGAADYKRGVAIAVADIQARRLQKVILSRVVPVAEAIDVVATYVVGRRGNNPARSFVLDLGGLQAAGFSPETVVVVAPDGTVTTQPLAGTRALLGDPSTDAARRGDLLVDPKEIFEHAISVKVACEELEPVCVRDSVRVDDYMTVKERGSVQHLGSQVSGRLLPRRSLWDALGALFPAVTVSGVPKLAACAFIRDHESEPRGLYSGAVLTVDADGSLDAAVVLRTVFQRDGRAWLRAGAGIVGQSVPERELEETCEKLRSVSRFLVSARAPATAGKA